MAENTNEKSHAQTRDAPAKEGAKKELPDIVDLGKIEDMTFGGGQQLTDLDHLWSSWKSRRFPS